MNQTLAVPRTAHWLFVFACVFTWPLLFIGGLVTTYRVGMAVPDWPTTFGINMFLYNFFNAAWGVFIEHGHRLYGSAVGLCLLIVAPWMLCIRNLPARFKVAAWVALVGVIIQGVMGGYRVRLNSTQLAMFHGCFGQLIFFYLACLAVWSGKTWHNLSDSENSKTSYLKKSHFYLALAIPVLIYFQIIAGAWLRHFQAPLKLYIHESLGIIVAISATIYAVRIRKSNLSAIRSVRVTRTMFISLVHFQIILGFVSWWLMRPFNGIAKPISDLQAVVRTTHQANGALVLALSGVLSMWVIRAFMSCNRSANTLVVEQETVCLS